MRVPTPSGSGSKATTTPSRLQATAIVGGALIGFLVMKTPEAYSRLEKVTDAACCRGDLSVQDVALVRQLLATAPHTSSL
ncbi:hypothetical protein [Pseudomonas sp. COR18]|uniref:hypothetical protein n=1 Tax=Pseudomonas sp. COR18 TaxID=3399680 RepID=UPI003B0030EB